MTREEKLKAELSAIKKAVRVFEKIAPELREGVLDALVEKYGGADDTAERAP